MRLITPTVILVVAALAVGAGSAQAAPTTIGSFPTWAVSPSASPGLTYAGSADFTAASGFPNVSVETNSTTVKTPSGDSAWLGDSTGFGAHFGSTRSQPYLYLSPAASGPSTTTLTFDGPPPAGWGLAVGDIDADFVQVIPKDVSGAVLPGAVLNAQDTSGTPLLNYCNNTPKPSTCTQPAPYTDSPFFFVNGTTITTPAGTQTYTTPIVKGNVVDTNGAYDWFLPSTDVRSITLIFTVQSGFPIYQVWLAAPAPVATIAGRVTTPDAAPIPPGTNVLLENADDTPVLDIENNPVSVPVEPDGSFEIVTEQGEYTLEFEVPDGFDPIPPIDVDATSATVDLGDIVLEPTAEPVDPPGGSDPDDGVDDGAVDELPATGIDPTAGLISAGLLGLAGLSLLAVRRRALRR